MFRDNKREIFGFRKYKAYGLASAVIAAFFLMGGVASADEVTSATSSDATAHVVASPTEVSADTATVASGEEVSANNGVAENTVANTATETPVVASGDRASANNEAENKVTTSSASSNEAVASESSSDRKISATLTVPVGQTITARSANDDATLLDKSKEQVINLNVSGEGILPEKSRIEITVTTDIDRGSSGVLFNDMKASSSTKVIDDNNGKIYKSVIDISGFQAGLQKEMIVLPNGLIGQEVSTNPMHRFTIYDLYVGDKLISSQKVTETFVPANPVLGLMPINNELTVERKSDSRIIESFRKQSIRNLKVLSRNWNSVYKFELTDTKARLIDPNKRIDYEQFRDESTNSYLIDYSILRQNFDADGSFAISVDTESTAKSEYAKSNATRRIASDLTVTMYYSDQPILDKTNLSSLKSVSGTAPVYTTIEEKILMLYAKYQI